jgi:hypothetical protein
MTNKFFSMTVAEMREAIATASPTEIGTMNAEVQRRIVKRQAAGKTLPRRLTMLEVDLGHLIAMNPDAA